MQMHCRLSLLLLEIFHRPALPCAALCMGSNAL